MTKRASLSKKTRFEVFKRDGFMCQYCGRSAPDVILHVDHIVPVASGGGNEITNLVTSCDMCNLGKGATAISDDSAVARQRKQMQELQARREMVEMMAQWRRELDSAHDAEVLSAAAYFLELSGWHLSEVGLRDLRKSIKKFGFADVLDAISTACEQYIKRGPDGVADRESVDVALKKVGGICFVRSQRKNAPWLTDFYRLRAAGRSLFGYWSDFAGGQLVRQALEAGHGYTELRTIMTEARSWSAWKQEMTELLEMGGDE